MDEINALRTQAKAAIEAERAAANRLKAADDEVRRLLWIGDDQAFEAEELATRWQDCATDQEGDEAKVATLEERIDQALAARRESPPCPFCKGPMLPTGTLGRRECFDCGATALVGRCIAQKVE